LRFRKCQKSREDQPARIGRNKTDRPKAEDARVVVATAVVVAETVARDPVVIVAATVVVAQAVATVGIAAIVVTAAAALMDRPKSISTS